MLIDMSDDEPADDRYANHTMIRITKVVRDRLKEIGRMGDSYDVVIARLLDERKDVE